MTVLLPSFIANGNWFLLALAIPVAALLVLLHPRWRVYCRRHFHTRQEALVLFVGAANAIFHYEIENLARFVYELCGRQNVPYWVAFGNLLFVMRGQRRLSVGDTDSDIGVLKTDFISQFGSFSNFSKRPRALMRIFGFIDKKWRTETGIKWLVNDDRTIQGKWLLYDQVLPLHDKPAFFLNVPVTIPHNPSYLARAEYGSNYMTPITMRMECIENMLNGYTFYKTSFLTKLRYGTTFVALAAGVTVLVANCVPPLRRALRANRRAKAEVLETAERGWDKYYV
ncbi:unnamed protein product [Peronospora destructor]|uniref:Uncharacterized protein n=1 Tax=Peronospora destructor TaxID=86335 RepID=A0AAV0URN1_9STRA|nr:unnamed protein product [Peronospora destructor]